MKIGDWIQLSVAIIALLGVLTSIWISIRTLRQNKKMIEEANRPYLIVYGTSLSVHTANYLIVLKNTGKSGATVTCFKSDIDLNDIWGFSEYFNKGASPFDRVENAFIAPGQSFVMHVDYHRACIIGKTKITFDLDYQNEFKKYSNRFVVDLLVQKHQISSKATVKTTDQELDVIAQCLQEELFRNL